MNEKMTNIKNAAKAVTLSGAMLFSGIGMAFQPACAATNPAGAPKKGDVYTGKAVAVKGWDRNKTRNAGAKLKINGTLGKNVKYLTGYCVDPNKTHPRKGYQYKYTAKVLKTRKVKNGVKVTGKVMYIPTKAQTAKNVKKTQRLVTNCYSFVKTIHK